MNNVSGAPEKLGAPDYYEFTKCFNKSKFLIMYLEYTCPDVSYAQWKYLMKGKRKMSYRWLVNKIKKEMPELFSEISLDLFNPWRNECYRTKTHFILTYSAIEYFFRK